jgi:hypothetical protein
VSEGHDIPWPDKQKYSDLRRGRPPGVNLNPPGDQELASSAAATGDSSKAAAKSRDTFHGVGYLKSGEAGGIGHFRRGLGLP